jgi:hypothetical protein
MGHRLTQIYTDKKINTDIIIYSENSSFFWTLSDVAKPFRRIGVRCQAGSHFFTTYMKLHQNGTVSWWLDWPKQWTDWTSNVEYWWRYALSILKQANRRISKSRFAPGHHSHFGGVGLLSLFFKIDRIHYSMLDVQCSMFDVLFLVNPLYETFKKFLFRFDRLFFWPAAGLTPETRHLSDSVQLFCKYGTNQYL